MIIESQLEHSLIYKGTYNKNKKETTGSPFYILY